MATEVDITLTEGNDETLNITITPVDVTQSLLTITLLELYLKPDSCVSDEDSELVLTSASATEINITSQTASEIVAQAFIPASALTQPYDRFWRIDALNAAGDRQTALFGEVEVNNV